LQPSPSPTCSLPPKVVEHFHKHFPYFLPFKTPLAGRPFCPTLFPPPHMDDKTEQSSPSVAEDTQTIIDRIFASQGNFRDLSRNEPQEKVYVIPDITILLPKYSGKTLSREPLLKILRCPDYNVLSSQIQSFTPKGKRIEFFLFDTTTLDQTHRALKGIAPLIGKLYRQDSVKVIRTFDHRFFRISIWGFKPYSKKFIVDFLRTKQDFPSLPLLRHIQLKTERFLGPTGGSAILLYSAAPAAFFNKDFPETISFEGYTINWRAPIPPYFLAFSCHKCTLDEWIPHAPHLCFLSVVHPDKYPLSQKEKAHSVDSLKRDSLDHPEGEGEKMTDASHPLFDIFTEGPESEWSLPPSSQNLSKEALIEALKPPPQPSSSSRDISPQLSPALMELIELSFTSLPPSGSKRKGHQ
jgi:hypothetical protein